MVYLVSHSAFHLAVALIPRRRDWMNPLLALEAFSCFLLTFVLRFFRFEINFILIKLELLLLSEVLIRGFSEVLINDVS